MNILWLGDLDCDQVALVGGKTAHLSRLAAIHRVPSGFCLTTATFDQAHELTDGGTDSALKALPPGGKLAVISDYLPARQTIPRLVEQRGCSWQITQDDGKTFRMEITKGGE